MQAIRFTSAVKHCFEHSTGVSIPIAGPRSRDPIVMLFKAVRHDTEEVSELAILYGDTVVYFLIFMSDMMGLGLKV